MNQKTQKMLLVIMAAIIVVLAAVLVMALTSGREESPVMQADPTIQTTQADPTQTIVHAGEEPTLPEEEPTENTEEDPREPTKKPSTSPNKKPSKNPTTPTKPKQETVIVQGNTGGQAAAQFGVVQSGEKIPDAPDDPVGEIQNVVSPVPTQPSTPTQSTTPPADQPAGPDLTLTFQEYEAMSGEEQMRFYYSFADADAFVRWYNEAKAAYEAENNNVYVGENGIVGPGVIE